MMEAVENRAALPIRQYPDMALRYVTRPLANADQTFLPALALALRSTIQQTGAAGLAAPQLGIGLRVFAFRNHDRQIILAVNPELEHTGELVTDIEGCLSLGPQMLLPVARHKHVRLHASDINGKAFVLQLSDWQARVVQHENDHLDGVLILDRSHSRPLLSNAGFAPERSFMRAPAPPGLSSINWL